MTPESKAILGLKIASDLKDLIQQATTERSHYYVASVCRNSILVIQTLLEQNERLVELLEKLEVECSMHMRDLSKKGVYISTSHIFAARELFTQNATVMKELAK